MNGEEEYLERCFREKIKDLMFDMDYITFCDYAKWELENNELLERFEGKVFILDENRWDNRRVRMTYTKINRR